MQWIIDNQSARRNLTKSQLVQAYAKYEAELTKEARAKQSESGGDKKSENAKSLSKNFDEAVEGIKVAAEVAKKIGVSEPTYRDMKVVVNEGTPEQIERMNNSAICRRYHDHKTTSKHPVLQAFIQGFSGITASRVYLYRVEPLCPKNANLHNGETA